MSGLTLPVNPETIHEELEQIERIVARWRESVGKGIVGIDLPAQDAEERLEMYLRQLTGELLFVGGKCTNLAMILAER